MLMHFHAGTSFREEALTIARLIAPGRDAWPVGASLPKTIRLSSFLAFMCFIILLKLTKLPLTTSSSGMSLSSIRRWMWSKETAVEPPLVWATLFGRSFMIASEVTQDEPGMEGGARWTE